LIHPVRPVGGAPLLVQYSALTAPLFVRLQLARLGRLYIPWHRLSLYLALLDRSDPSKPATLATRRTFNVPAAAASGTLTGLAADRQEPFPIEPWQPWPAREPFADEIMRWWPSDEAPPDMPTVVLEQGPADRPPQFVLWPAYGGLLDTWV